ncbi:MAG: hypothetical protein WAM42_25245, partial [Candidatus Nitrosopolaris sp.]
SIVNCCSDFAPVITILPDATLGSENNFFGVDGIEQNAFKMKSIADASILRNQVIEILEQAHVEQDDINSRR